MTKNYLALFWLSLISIIIFAVILIFLIVFSKKIILSKKYGMILLFFISLVICTLSVSMFIRCCKDYKYFSTGTYIEATGTVVDYMYIKRDYDGNGEVLYRKPKFFIVETGEYIVLNTKEVSKGKKYTIKYYPNTKICEVTEYIEYTSKSQAKGNGFQALRAKMDIIDDANGLKGELVKFGEY